MSELLRQREAALRRDKFIGRLAAGVMASMLTATGVMYFRERDVAEHAKEDAEKEAARDGFNNVDIIKLSHTEGTATLQLNLGSCVLQNVAAELEMDGTSVTDIMNYSAADMDSYLPQRGGAGGLHGLQSRIAPNQQPATLSFRSFDELIDLTNNNPC